MRRVLLSLVLCLSSAAAIADSPSLTDEQRGAVQLVLKSRLSDPDWASFGAMKASTDIDIKIVCGWVTPRGYSAVPFIVALNTSDVTASAVMVADPSDDLKRQEVASMCRAKNLPLP